MSRRRLARLARHAGGVALLLAAPAWAEGTAVSADKSEIVVTASRLDLLGKATTASQGTITRKEVELRPIYRAAQLYESIPGLVVTVHSGEGKA